MKGLEKEKSKKEEIEEKEEKQETAKIKETEEIEKKGEKLEDKETKKYEKAEGEPKKLEKIFKTMIGSENKKKRILISSIAVAVIIIGMIFSTIFALCNTNHEKIIKGVTISGIDVSGLSQEEAKEKMNGIYENKKEQEIKVQYQDYEATLNPTLMEVNYEIDKAVEEAYSVGRKDNIFINNYKILFTLIGKKNIDMNVGLNEDVAKQSIEDIGVNLPGVMIDSSYAIEEDELIITRGKAGIVIKKEDLLNKVKEILKNPNSNEEYIEIPVEQKEPQAIDIDKIHEEVYQEVKDAYYTKEPFTIYPEVEGIDFDVEAARELLKEEKDEYIIKLIITKPKITIDQIGSEAFPDQLATFSTNYNGGDVNRTTNLQIACQKINGKVILPGETFSYNKALGPRTAAAGYKNGKVYEGGEVVDGIGGGICQISSTLYNTVLMANLDIIERRNHQFVTSYLPAGRDATVVYGAIDFKFKNTRKYPVRIIASARNGVATVSLYGNKEESEYTFSFSTKTIASIPFTTKYEEDATLPAGTEKVRQKGANGVKTETYITKMLNGKVVSSTLLSKDTYDAMTKIIVKSGAGAVATPPTTTEEKPKEETPKPSTPVNNTQGTGNDSKGNNTSETQASSKPKN